MHSNANAAARVRFAELSSSLGAGVLGVGLGVLAASYLRGLGLAIATIGLVLHAWGMTDKHLLETRQGARRVWWSTLLYWICWAALGILVLYTVWVRVR
jgi:hypothetical protein